MAKTVAPLVGVYDGSGALTGIAADIRGAGAVANPATFGRVSEVDALKLSALSSEGRAVHRAAMQRWFSNPVPRAFVKSREDIYRARAWSAGERVEVGAVRLPTAYYAGNNTAAIKIHRCITAGTTGASEPAWATADYHVTPASSDTADGSAVWRAYNIVHMDSSRADNTGDGSQLNPYKDWRALDVAAPKATSAFASGRAIALKRGSVFNSYQVTNGAGSLARLYFQKPSGDTALYPERRTLMAYGQGNLPVVDGGGNGVLRFGIRTNYTTATNHEGFLTIQDIAVTAIGGTLPGSSGAAIFAPVSATELPGYSTHPQSVVVLGCRIYNFRPTAYQTVSDGDVNGIQTFGRFNEILSNTITDCGDDGIWFIGSDGVIAGNRTSGNGAATTEFPARERGDECQCNSSMIRDNGDTPCHNVKIIGNEFHHTRPQKHALIVNPEVSGVDVRSKGYVIAYNRLVGYRGALGTSQIPLYVSGIEADVHNNLIDGGHIRGAADNSCVTCFAKIKAYNNYIIVRGDQRGIELGTMSYTYTSVIDGSVRTFTNTATGSEIFNNTLINEGAAQMGILNWSSGVTVSAHANTIIGFTTGIQGVSGSVAGNNAFSGVTTNYSGGLTQGGSDVTGDMVAYRGVPYSLTSPLVGATRLAYEYLAEDFSGVRRGGVYPAIGAFEYRDLD